MKTIDGASKEIKPIEGIDVTDNLISGRAGLAPIAAFIKKSGIPDAIAQLCPIKKSAKGVADTNIYHQIITNFIDGSSTSLSHFDELRNDPAHLRCLGLDPDQAASSHCVKRFIGKMTRADSRRFRRVLLELFQQRLRQEKTKQIILDIDTVVYDNDTALVREGCEPTYKKVKGFQPLMIKWNGLVIWSEFRKGSVHSNHGRTVVHALQILTKIIRNVLGADASIIVTIDSGFFDQKNFAYMEHHNIQYVCSGKQYKDLLKHIKSIPAKDFLIFKAGGPDDDVWEYVELNDQRGSWDISRRAIYTRRTRTKNGQPELLGLEAVYYTNLDWDSRKIIELAHGRGAAELIHRKLKDFAGELLPFQAFDQNEAWFFLMLIAFNAFELFKEGIDATLHTASMYPTTFRRKFIDIAGKIVVHAHKTILKTTAAHYQNLKAMWDYQQELIFA